MKPRFALSRIVFFGAGAFAVPALRKLARDGAKDAGVEIALVVSSPPRPAGRKMALRASPVAAEARELGLEVAEVSTPADAIAKIREIGARSFVVCDYGRILPRGLLRLPRDGGLNIHASLLPRWRGASPVRSAILAGDETTGVTIMKMDTGMDTGMILLSRETPIAPDETGGALSERLSAMGAEMIVETLNALRDLEEFPQLGRATYAGKLGAEERWLNFQNPAEMECRRIRAFAPTPGARLILRGTEIKVLSGSVSEIRGEPGQSVVRGRNRFGAWLRRRRGRRNHFDSHAAFRWPRDVGGRFLTRLQGGAGRFGAAEAIVFNCLRVMELFEGDGFWLLICMITPR